jgi:hypothetical protein
MRSGTSSAVPDLALCGVERGSMARRRRFRRRRSLVAVAAAVAAAAAAAEVFSAQISHRFEDDPRSRPQLRLPPWKCPSIRIHGCRLPIPWRLDTTERHGRPMQHQTVRIPLRTAPATASRSGKPCLTSRRGSSETGSTVGNGRMRTRLQPRADPGPLCRRARWCIGRTGVSPI